MASLTAVLTAFCLAADSAAWKAEWTDISPAEKRVLSLAANKVAAKAAK
jgi:hypothetical protein